MWESELTINRVYDANVVLRPRDNVWASLREPHEKKKDMGSRQTMLMTLRSGKIFSCGMHVTERLHNNLISLNAPLFFWLDIASSFGSV